MKIFAPSRSQRNHRSGLFQAQSLGSIQQVSSKPVDLEAAKADIRRQRRILSGEYEKLATVTEAQKKRAVFLRRWWHYRRSWRSVRVGSRVGKFNPQHSSYRGWVEFPDGTQEWVELG